MATASPTSETTITTNADTGGLLNSKTAGTRIGPIDLDLSSDKYFSYRFDLTLASANTLVSGDSVRVEVYAPNADTGEECRPLDSFVSGTNATGTDGVRCGWVWAHPAIPVVDNLQIMVTVNGYDTAASGNSLAVYGTNEESLDGGGGA